MRIVEPSKGTVELEGVNITKESGKAYEVRARACR